MVQANEPIVRLDDVSKRFILRGHGMNPVKRVARKLLRDAGRREHWALRNVNLQIAPGETVALMGVNGSGKSTMLKLISQVMSPTSGTVHVGGRVGGIIDLAAGFHPELSGFENIFLNGALLGLPRQVIWSRLKQIEDFCELGTFLNSPVRHYSMGMFLRLAFSLAVHTDPDVFVVDEALAVGDGYFQWKCMRKIEELQRQGKTILFVSHVPEVAETLCQRAIWIHEGGIRADGPSTEVVQKYNAFLFKGLLEGEPSNDIPEMGTIIPHNRFGTGEAVIQNVVLRDESGAQRRFFQSGEPLNVSFTVRAKREMRDAAYYVIVNRPSQPVSFYDSSDRGTLCPLREGENELTVRVPDLRLRAGTYYLTIAVGEVGNHAHLYDCHQKMYAINVVERNAEDAGGMAYSHRVVDLRPEIRLESLAR